MDKMEDMEEEWNKMMSTMHKVDELIRKMPTDGIQEIHKEWDNVMNGITKMQNMMAEKRM